MPLFQHTQVAFAPLGERLLSDTNGTTHLGAPGGYERCLDGKYLDGKKYQYDLLQAAIIYASTPPRLYASMPPYFLLSHLRLHASVPLHACTPARFRTLQASMPTCLHVGHTHPRASAPPYLHVSMSTYGKTRLHVSMPPSHTWAYKPLRVHDSTPSCLRAYMGLQASRPQYLSTCVRTSRLHISMVPCPSVGIHVYIPP